METEKNKPIETEELEDLFHQTVTNFKLRWLNKGTKISPAGIYNYALSIMAYEFGNKFDEDEKEKILSVYKYK